MKNSSIPFVIATTLIFGFIAFYFLQPFPETTLKEKASKTEQQYYDKLKAQQEQNESNQQTAETNSPSPDNYPDTPQPAQTPPRPVYTQQTTNQIIIPYYTNDKAPNIKYIQIEINDVTTTAILDTGSSALTINTFSAQQIKPLLSPGIAINTPAGSSIAYPFTASKVKIGDITLHDIKAVYIPTSKENLIGGSLLNNFTYTIDQMHHTITLAPVNNNYETDYPIDPRSIDGTAEINGNKYIISGKHLYKEE